MPRFAKKVDRSQSKIVKAMRKFSQVIVTNMGLDFPDLVCGFAYKWKFAEVKEIDGSFSRGQLEFLATARGPVDVVVSEDDGIESIRADRYLMPHQQREIDAWLIRNPTQESLATRQFLKLIGRDTIEIVKRAVGK